MTKREAQERMQKIRETLDRMAIEMGELRCEYRELNIQIGRMEYADRAR
jgi:hypothetical protein